jgi:hypothetical protein
MRRRRSDSPFHQACTPRRSVRVGSIADDDDAPDIAGVNGVAVPSTS